MDRWLNAGRGMALLRVSLGLLLHRWARALYGPLPAAAALALCLVEPNLLANATKYSALLLLPLVGVTLAVAAWRGALPRRTAVLAAAATLVTTWALVWAAYGFRYAPSSTAGWLLSSESLPGARELAGTALEAAVAWCDRVRLLPNAYGNGFLLGQAKALHRSAWLLGEVTSEGRLAYFPLVLAVKTPAATLLLYLAGVTVAVWRCGRAGPRHELFVLVPLVTYGAIAVTSPAWTGASRCVASTRPWSSARPRSSSATPSACSGWTRPGGSRPRPSASADPRTPPERALPGRRLRDRLA